MRSSQKLVAATVTALLGGGTGALADSTTASCDIYAAGEDHASSMTRCTFSQRQGYITISYEDGATHELSPVGDAAPGTYRDQEGRTVFRQSGLGDQGLIFRFPDESVYVYWSTSALDAAEGDNPTAPFSTRDYDATTLLICRNKGDAEARSCPAGVLRMENGQGSVVVLSPAGERFTINFMQDNVNASNREVQATLEGDTWIVTIDGGETYEVPKAFIEGG